MKKIHFILLSILSISLLSCHDNIDSTDISTNLSSDIITSSDISTNSNYNESSEDLIISDNISLNSNSSSEDLIISDNTFTNSNSSSELSSLISSSDKELIITDPNDNQNWNSIIWL